LYDIYPLKTINPKSKIRYCPVNFDARTPGNTRPAFFQQSYNADPGRNARGYLASLGHFLVADDGTVPAKVFVGVPLEDFNRTFTPGEGFAYVGKPNDSSAGSKYLWSHTFQSGMTSTLRATFQRVNVEGDVKVSTLVHDLTEPQRVCVTSAGKLTLDCPHIDTPYACTGTAPDHASLCAGDDRGSARTHPSPSWTRARTA